MVQEAAHRVVVLVRHWLQRGLVPLKDVQDMLQQVCTGLEAHRGKRLASTKTRLAFGSVLFQLIEKTASR